MHLSTIFPPSFHPPTVRQHQGPQRPCVAEGRGDLRSTPYWLLIVDDFALEPWDLSANMVVYYCKCFILDDLGVPQYDQLMLIHGKPYG